MMNGVELVSPPVPLSSAHVTGSRTVVESRKGSGRSRQVVESRKKVKDSDRVK